MKKIEEWEILTDEGWKDFNGVIEYDEKEIYFVKTQSFELRCSEDHIFFDEDKNEIKVADLKEGMKIETENGLEEVVLIKKENFKEKVYDIVGVETSKYYANGILSHNCDELAFVPPRIQEELMASILPALSSTKGKIMITSTPNGNKDLFSKIWFDTGMVWDPEEHTYLRLKPPKNNFEPLFIPFWIDPEKNTPEWIKSQKGDIDPIKWKVEYECLGGNTIVQVYDKKTDEIIDISLSDLYNILKEENSKGS
jgi:hypothetical protein